MSIELPVIGENNSYCIHPGKILAVGLNYSSHIEESPSLKVRSLDKTAIPEEPILFNKTPNVLIGPNEEIIIPKCISDYEWAPTSRTDYEGELVVIMGRRGKHIPEEDALNYVFGYTCGNDISQRNIQNADRSGWFRGKSFDTFGPVGPAIVPARNMDKPQKLKIETRLNGKVVQSDSTQSMLFPVSRIISFISRQMVIEEGDLIFTGTPSGVGPIAPGDILEVEIEKIGILKNTVIREN